MRNMIFLFCALWFSLAAVESPIEKHLKRVEDKASATTIRNIDFIYLINLDQRPERLARMKADFSVYGITPCRFAAIYGWSLPPSVFEDVGVLFRRGMPMRVSPWIKTGGLVRLIPGHGDPFQLDPSFYQKKGFSTSISPGGVGCTLSHLSVLQDALESGYNTIWVLEDDVKPLENPHQLSDWIDQLDALVGPDNWDVLYTDCVTYFSKPDDIEWIWRPDTHIIYEKLTRTQKIGGFLQIGGRGHAHSMIIRRSGMKKILEFLLNHGIFLPYDMELSIIPGIRLFNLQKNVVIQNIGPPETNSDTWKRHFQ